MSASVLPGFSMKRAKQLGSSSTCSPWSPSWCSDFD
jgi:hypothetical protein